MGRWDSDPTEFAGRVVSALVTGLAEKLAVGDLVAAAGAQRLLVVELVGR
jgi:hypothetical protein